MITNLLTATITAYCACTTCCGPKASGLAANGQPPVEGRTIAASRSLPFGTMIHIPNVGWRKVEDRLAKRYDHRIDIYFKKHADAKKFGIRKETVKIVTK